MLTLPAQNGTIIDSTRLNTAFGHFSAFDPVNVAFNITQDTLNDYLLNMTTSLMVAYGIWNTSANATIVTNTNVYSFSQPLNLLLPYFISLGLAMPFIILGGFALLTNGTYFFKSIPETETLAIRSYSYKYRTF